MITHQRTLIYIQNWLRNLNVALFVSVLILCGFFLYLFLAPLEESPLTLSHTIPAKKQEVKNYDAIGMGALALRKEIQSFPVPDLSREVEVKGITSRPDQSFYDLKLIVELKGGERLKTPFGRILYLSYGEQALNFSREVTPLWIKPSAMDGERVQFEMGISLTSEESGVLLEQKGTFSLSVGRKVLEIGEVQDPSLASGAKELSLGKWWPPDRLFEEYGGEEYQEYKGLERLKLEEEVLFVREGDLFIWKEGHWKKEEVTKGYPLAQVAQVTPYKMEWRIWDKSGVEQVSLSFAKERTTPLSLRVEDVFTRLRQRTSSRVSCRLNQRATILKEGDWVVRTQNGWHTIKNYFEVVALLNFKIEGELFIFDGVEKGDGKLVFKGTLFDKTRTQVQYVRLPMSQIKTIEHSSPTKKDFSAKIRPTSAEDQNPQAPKRKSSQAIQRREQTHLGEYDRQLVQPIEEDSQIEY